MFTIKKRYNITRKLGEGGMGTVYLVDDMAKENQKFALKTIKKELINKDVLKIFRNEFEVMTRLKHPNLVRVYDFGMDKAEEIYYITMEYVDGISLRNFLQQQSKIAEKKALMIMVALCRTLEFIHSRKIVHRDIKPNNIMVVGNKIKVMDFGLADLSLTGLKQTKGTLLYMSPETLTGEIHDGVDIYAAGMTFYELLTGTLFFHNKRFSTIVRLLKNRPEFNQTAETALERIQNPAFKKIIRKMTSYNHEDRYTSCSEVILDINNNLKKNYLLETVKTRVAYVLGANFVGREHELTGLSDWLHTSGSEKKLMLVHGETGIGKSRLYQEFKHYCQLENIQFLQGDCVDISQRKFEVFLPILSESLLHVPEEIVTQYGPEFKKLLPNHVRLHDTKVNPSQGPKTDHGILIQNITNFLIDYGEHQKKTVVLYLNDMNWSDEASVEALEELMYKLNTVSSYLKVCASSREEGIEKMERIKTKGRVTELELRPFDEYNVESYIEVVFGREKIGESLRSIISEINEKVGGNPFFLQSLIKSLVEVGLIARKKHQWELTKPIEKTRIPSNLKELILSRLKRLDFTEKEKRIVHILALLSYSPTFEELNIIVPVEQEFLARLELLEILRTEAVEGKIVYCTAHDLIRETILDQIQNKKELHQFIGEKLESIYQNDQDKYITEIAYHFTRSENKAKALPYLERAGDAAKSQFNNQLATDFYCQLLNWLGENEKEKKIDSLLKMVDVLELVGRWNECHAELEKALQLSVTISDKQRIAKVNYLLGINYWRKGEYDQATTYLEKSLKLYKELGNKTGISIAVSGMGHVYKDTGYFQKAMTCYEKSLNIEQELGDKKGIAGAVNNIGIIYYNNGNYDQAITFYKRAVEINEELGNKLWIAKNVGNIGIIYNAKSDYGNAMNCFTRQLKISKELGDKEGIATTIGNIGIVHRDEGDYISAMSCFEQWLSICEELGNKSGMSYAFCNIGTLNYDQGDDDTAMSYFQKSFKIFQELNDKYGLAMVLERMGFACKNKANYGLALQYYDQAIGIGKELELDFFLCGYLLKKAEILLLLQKYDEAKNLYTQGLQIAERVNNDEHIFYGRLLGAKINFALGNKEHSVNYVKTMLENSEDISEKGNLNYEVWKMTKEEKYGKSALAYMKSLEPRREHKEIITEIESEIQKSKTAFSKHKNDYFRELLEIIQQLNSFLILKELLERIVDLNIEFIQADRGIILLFNPKGKLEVQVARNKRKISLTEEEYTISYTAVRKVIETGNSLFVPNIEEAGELLKAKSVTNMKLQSVMCIPLGKRLPENLSIERRSYHAPVGHQLLGVLYLDSRNVTDKSRFTGDNLELLQALADQASVALVNAWLHEKVNIDNLTGLYLRHYFEESLQNELRLSKKTGSFVAVMMIDIDFFKSVNDNYGHNTGDEVLRMLGELFKKAFRTSDLCARYGGEEFTVLLPNTDVFQAKIVAIKVLENVRSHNFPCGKVTVSIGISAFTEHVKDKKLSIQADNLIKYADQALYYAKEMGRDRCEVWHPALLEMQKERTAVTDILTGDPIRDYRNVQALLEAIRLSSSSLDLEKLLDRIMDMILEITKSERAILLLFDEQVQGLKIKKTRTISGKKLKGAIIYSKSIAVKAFEEDAPICITDITQDAATSSAIELDLRSIMCFVLHVRQKRLGIIYLDSQSVLREFSKVEISFIQALTSQVAGAIEKAPLPITEPPLVRRG